MTHTHPPGETIGMRVRTVSDTLLTGLQRRLARGVDRHLPALLSRNTPPDSPALWLALDLTGLHEAAESGLNEQAYKQAATAVTAAAQIWARTDVPHARTSAQQPTTLGAVLARVARSRTSAEDDLARALRTHTLDEVTARLRPLIGQARPLGVSLDYGLLAADLDAWQFPGGPHRTGQRWAHAYTKAKALANRTASSPTADRKAPPA
ncbi:type I-E CRISPR-associated protein Cse2/CasB [Streptomyces lydicus]|uniref:type I-E CRISPR-associated protein Cse2/CasB n=1 Tax=Streptomyces lydicus TaxID=47763 RepID=UPI00101259FB|nr:type I-E CRISPR-associated protein Cse2/CasB [Streptomyces lydicus]MCZ1012133.1 type I-E CRISPR-associated protein Cse2/CasB [Streptomyces lydicus]